MLNAANLSTRMKKLKTVCSLNGIAASSSEISEMECNWISFMRWWVRKLKKAFSIFIEFYCESFRSNFFRGGWTLSNKKGRNGRKTWKYPEKSFQSFLHFYWILLRNLSIKFLQGAGHYRIKKGGKVIGSKQVKNKMKNSQKFEFKPLKNQRKKGW